MTFSISGFRWLSFMSQRAEDLNSSVSLSPRAIGFRISCSGSQQRRQHVLLVAPDQPVAPLRIPTCAEEVERPLPLLRRLVDGLDGLKRQGHAHRRHHAEGCAYLLVGVEPGVPSGVVPEDSAVILQGVEAYTGSGGPRWTPNYVQLDGKAVLVFVVEPPNWGDPIYGLHKEYQRYRQAQIFVRKPGKTDFADNADLAMLSERVRRTANSIAVAVTWPARAPPDVPALNTREVDLGYWRGLEREQLLKPLDTFPEVRYPREFGAPGAGSTKRSAPHDPAAQRPSALSQRRWRGVSVSRSSTWRV